MNRMSFYGGAWFAFLAIISAKSITAYHWASPTCIGILYLLFALMMWIRPAAKFQSHGLLPRVMAFIGTYTPWTMSFFPQTDYAWANWLSPIFVISGLLLAIFALLHLRTAFSLVPQARFIVRGGPYRWLRHPLYVAEEIAVIGVLLQHLSPISVLIVAGHLAVQISRIYYEEELLGRSFPKYVSFAPKWRLVPFVY
jgi:protein-S-isoprenylcysteine O-methyltransferase Ste14